MSKTLRRGRKSKKEVEDLDITSLMDILVILLVFLLKNFSSSGVVFDIPTGIVLPYSKSSNLNHPGINVQVSDEKIWVDDKVIAETKKLTAQDSDMGGKRIIPLYEALVAKRNTYKNMQKATQGATKFTGVINFIIHQELKYEYIQKLMFTSAEAGFAHFKLIVSKND